MTTSQRVRLRNGAESLPRCSYLLGGEKQVKAHILTIPTSPSDVKGKIRLSALVPEELGPHWSLLGLRALVAGSSSLTLSPALRSVVLALVLSCLCAPRIHMQISAKVRSGRLCPPWVPASEYP